MGFSLNQLSRMNGEQRVMAARERELNDLLFQIGMKGSEALYGESSLEQRAAATCHSWVGCPCLIHRQST